MVEALGGKAHLAVLELGGKLVPFRYWKELSEIRHARYEEKSLTRDEKKLLIDESKRKLKDFIADEKDGLQHAVNAVGFLYVLIRNCAYDIHTIKSVIREMYKKDIKLKGRGFPVQIEQQLEVEVMKTLKQINDKLREGSDLWGALTRE